MNNYWLVLGIVNGQASLLGRFDDKGEAMRYAASAAHDHEGVSVWRFGVVLMSLGPMEQE